MAALSLADYRARVAAMYLSDRDLAAFRVARDDLFATHPRSAAPGPLRYFDPDPGWVVEVSPRPASGFLEIDTGGPDGVLRYERVGILDTPWGPLTLFWLAAYGGGLFLPFRDATCGRESYGGGRYLYDTVKGADLGTTFDGELVLDLNFLYAPSCAHDEAWACPLAPPGNRLEVAVTAAELTSG